MSKKIAIVEDETAIRENYADVLRKQGYEVDTFSNRKEAMTSFETVSYTHLRAHETKANLVCRLLLEKKKNKNQNFKLFKKLF